MRLSRQMGWSEPRPKLKPCYADFSFTTITLRFCVWSKKTDVSRKHPSVLVNHKFFISLENGHVREVFRFYQYYLHFISFNYMELKNLSSNNTIYIDKFRYTAMINSKNKFEKLVWRLMKGLARN